MVIHYQRGGNLVKGKQANSTYIYELFDPLDKMPRYVGKTVYPQSRYSKHIKDAEQGRRYHSCRWINSLLQQGRKPVMMVTHIATGDGADKEREFIQLYQDSGFDLTNHTDGGEGAPGRKRSEDSKRKTADSVKNAWQERYTTTGVLPLKEQKALRREERKQKAQAKAAEKAAKRLARLANPQRRKTPMIERLAFRNTLVPLTINGATAMLPVGDGQYALIDRDEWDKVSSHYWRVVQATNGMRKVCTWNVSNPKRELLYLGRLLTGRKARRANVSSLDYRASAYYT